MYVPISNLIDFHNAHGKLATVTAVRPPARFGHMEIHDNVVDRFGEKNQGMLSFPSKGWTLAIDVAADFPNLQHILNELDAELVARDGRIYLAKDSRMNSRHVTQMYPLSEEFKRIRSRFDPNGVIQSNLSRRLNI